ncbi:hypothetical protein [Teichococcus vastitatis]|uniref:hypothetical protein n=1 Tax=Teichococcus vastitatis TaxID=2307076 RepID=UPI0013003993|nr:hypothetical protein [Pseudoroseomonas vastitatis]
MRLRGLAAAGLLAGTLGACVAPGSQDDAALRPSLDQVVGRLPVEAAGFTRGMTADMEASQPGQGRAVDYATAARDGVAARAAIASVMVYDHGVPPLPSDTPDAVVLAKLGEGVAEALSPAPGRSMTERERHALPVAGGGPLQCAVLGGSYGRTAMWQQVCVGVAGGRFLKVFVAVPERQRSLLNLDADGFARGIALATRGVPAAGDAAR